MTTAESRRGHQHPGGTWCPQLEHGGSPSLRVCFGLQVFTALCPHTICQRALQLPHPCPLPLWAGQIPLPPASEHGHVTGQQRKTVTLMCNSGVRPQRAAGSPRVTACWPWAGEQSQPFSAGPRPHQSLRRFKSHKNAFVACC